MTPAILGVAVVLWLIAAGAILALVYRKEVAAAWKEPVVVAPVLIFESDDWGFGLIEQEQRLQELSQILARHRDAVGRHAVMTLGVILGGPDVVRIAANDCRSYHRVTLADSVLDGVRRTMIAGASQGVFYLQLHGMEHFWAPGLLETARIDPSVRRWLTTRALPKTEDLPPHLQSRWLNASRLPSTDLPRDVVVSAAKEEAKAFAAIFGTAPEVVVPPTFAWSLAVERAWTDAGIGLLITPGRRYDRRDADGKLVPVAGTLRNGEYSPSGLMYLVRNDYFEPVLGHTAERGLAGLREKTRLGRPTLLEMHRLNFVGDADDAAKALAELNRLLGQAVASFPNLRFMSSADLGRHFRENSALLEHRFAPRLNCFIARLAACSRLWKLGCASGVAIPVGLLWLATGGSRRSHEVRHSPAAGNLA